MKIITAITELLMLFPGFGRVHAERVIGTEEGIEDSDTVDSYEKTSRMLPFRLLRKLAVCRLKKLKPKGMMADLGCGPGYITGEIARALPKLKITALDISEEMLERARKNLSAPDIRNRITYQPGDIFELPFGNNSLDFVVSTFSLHHWDDPQKGFSEIHRVLKKGGGFMVFDIRRDSPRLFYLILKFAQKFILPQQLVEKDEPTSSVKASYTPEEAGGFLKDLPFGEVRATGGIFWLFVTGRKI
ncbi:MAG: methyltransferase domain-containing protein [Dehalococcoidales bacterium]|nr:methyltransferase domain-containing protein [Dehalococcoidales bacterium]